MAALADDHLLPKVPPVVIMDRRQLLLQALSKLGRPNPDEEIRSLGHGDYLCTVTVEVPPHSLRSQVSKQRFTGFSSLTPCDAARQAYDAALAYLESNGLIIVDDFNRPAKKQMLCAQTFADLFQQKITVLQNMAHKHRVLLEDINAQLHDACIADPDHLSVRIT
ncbi:hypothetical protein EJB05_51212 [Eragrostis curvula]|uniref:Uncharacterized protein n=1 Tax=Eragrostis curvula TaxID=38414 RepID=A0A5J9SWB6_9POAL|nr:hypothetical protein EJB05_51212 [Eragrostis curvula]